MNGLGMNGTDEGSCRYHLNNDLFRPLEIAEDKIIFFDGRAKNLQAQCDGVEDYIHLMGGIDVAILGLGMNGHVGMNEPGTPPGTAFAHCRYRPHDAGSGAKIF